VRAARRAFVVLFLLAVAAAITWAFWPAPVRAEMARVARGPMRVTVDEDGQTRIKERYIVSAPLAGRLARVALREGDAVVAGETVLASIDPLDPTLLDPRARAEAEARVRAAQAALDQAGAAILSANAAMELTQTELERLREAAARSATSAQEMIRAEVLARIRAEEARAAGFARDIAQFELELAHAALLRTTPGFDETEWRFRMTAPVSGRVLRVIQESAAVVQAGTPLIELGDPEDLELVVDILSSDAVAVRPGAEAILERWGGEAPLNGRVRLVEPAAFTKISALGVEEQRVNVIIDFADPPAARAGLGDAYRVEARVVVWESPDVLKVPTGALFRHADSWAVFVVADGRAAARDVAIGRRNGQEAQVVSGLAEGETIVVYPSDQVRAGVRIEPRNE
jgi:HlyD family secretion protein